MVCKKFILNTRGLFSGCRNWKSSTSEVFSKVLLEVGPAANTRGGQHATWGVSVERNASSNLLLNKFRQFIVRVDTSALRAIKEIASFASQFHPRQPRRSTSPWNYDRRYLFFVLLVQVFSRNDKLEEFASLVERLRTVRSERGVACEKWEFVKKTIETNLLMDLDSREGCQGKR